MNRAYSFLTVKAVDDEQRVITGVATSPTPDRMGDIVEPLGIKFKNPMPLLWQHRNAEPVGTVRFDKPTKDGITFEAKMPKVADAGKLKDRIDEAWQSVKLGLVRAVSIGFRSIEMSFMNDGGIHFLESEVLELSLVTIPAQADAQIETIKSIDAPLLAKAGLVQTERERSQLRKEMEMMQMPSPASDEAQPAFMARCVDHMLNCSEGMTQAEASAHCAIKWDNREMPGDATQMGASSSRTKKIDARLPAAPGSTQNGSDRTKPPGVTGQTKPVKAMEARTMKKNITEQIASFEATRQAKSSEMDRIMDDAAEKGETLDNAAKETYDTLAGEVKEIDEHLVRLREREKTAQSTAVVVDNVRTADDAGRLRGGVSVSIKPHNLAKGIPFVRMVGALVQAKGNRLEAASIAQRWKDSTPEVEAVLRIPSDLIEKTAVDPGTTTGSTWAAPLVVYQNLASEFIDYLRPLTIIGRIQGFRRVPFKVKVPRMTAGASVNWVGEGKVKPLSSLAFDTLTLEFFKLAGIIPLSEELVRFSTPSAEMLVRDDLAGAIVQMMDRDFVDPTKALAATVSPASITNGVTPVTSTGSTAAAFRADVKTLFAAFFTAGIPISTGVWIMSQSQALAFSLMNNSLGQPEFPNITVAGGTLLGFPVVTSENVPTTGGSPTDGGLIIFALANEIMLADDGGVTIDVSREASLQMETTPDSPATASTTLVSLWQHNMIAIKAERFINWLKRRDAAVQFIQNAKYSP